MALLKTGDAVTILDENGKQVRGKLHSRGQANDGTGRIGWHVETEPGTLYWRPDSSVKR